MPSIACLDIGEFCLVDELVLEERVNFKKSDINNYIINQVIIVCKVTVLPFFKLLCIYYCYFVLFTFISNCVSTNQITKSSWRSWVLVCWFSPFLLCCISMIVLYGIQSYNFDMQWKNQLFYFSIWYSYLEKTNQFTSVFFTFALHFWDTSLNFRTWIFRSMFFAVCRLKASMERM